MQCDYETVDVTISDEDFLILAKEAHRNKITLNHHITNLLWRKVVKDLEEENKNLKNKTSL